MTHILPSRWPKLCEYYDSWRIKSHWPRGMGTIWALPPAINVLFYWQTLDPHYKGPYELGQRLYDNSGTTQRFKKTTWHIEYQDMTLDIWTHTILRDWGWEYDFQAYLYDQEDHLVGLGEKTTRFATPGTQQYPPWMQGQTIVGIPIGHPYMGFGLYALPSSLANMWPEVPRPLGDRAEARSTVPELSGDRS